MKSPIFSKPTRWQETLLILSIALVAGGLTVYSVLRLRAATPNPAPTPVVSRISAPGVAALGYLEPRGEVIHISAPAFREGVQVQQLLVKQGDRVKIGQVIAILDNQARLQATLQETKRQVQVAQARLSQVKAGSKSGDIFAQDARFQGSKAELEGQINVQRAIIANLQARLKGERSAQQAAIERLKAEWRNAQEDCQRYQTLYRDGGVSAQERDNRCLKEETTRKQLQEAQVTLTQIVTTRQEQMTEAQANRQRTIATLQRQIEAAQGTLNAIAQVRPVDVQVAQAEVAAAQSAVQRAQADLDLAYVRSPKDGQILKIHTWPGEIVSDKGIVEIGQTSQMYVRAEVYETDISRVRMGQQATIKTNGVIGDLRGVVDEIGLQIGKKDVLGTDPTADADVRVVEVKIRLEPQDSERVANLTNLQVNVVIDWLN